MRRLIGVGVVLLLGLVALPAATSAQNSQAGREPKFQLEQNYPNPFNPTTRIPFTLNAALFEGGQAVTVSIRIYNVLSQLVAVPTALDHPGGSALPVNDLQYTSPGTKVAYWDGLDQQGRKVASGVYIYQLVVNGERAPPQKMVVAN